MKEKALVYLSLAISIAAFCYAAWVHQQAAQLAEQALQNRERQFVQVLAPKIREAYKNLGMTNAVGNPMKLDELIAPYLEMVMAMANCKMWTNQQPSKSPTADDAICDLALVLGGTLHLANRRWLSPRL